MSTVLNEYMMMMMMIHFIEVLETYFMY